MGTIRFFKPILSILVFGAVLSVMSAHAQTIDPSMLEALKNRSGATQGPVTISSPLDVARQAEYDQRKAYLQQQASIENDKLSRIEVDYQARLDSEIRQFGYELFNFPPVDQGIITGAISDDYILGIGDSLLVTFQGTKSLSYTVAIDHEGRVIIPDLTPVFASGKTFGNFRNALKEKVRESLIGTEVYVSMASVRMISVIVVGEIKTPGIIKANSLTSPLEILMMAGGVRKTGSLRNIAIYRNGQVEILDLYDLLTGKSSYKIQLRDGDRIIVPTIGATIAMEGEFVRPAIYELAEGTSRISYGKALELAGGTIRPYGYAISHLKINQAGQQSFHKADKSSLVHNGEAIIASLKENSQTGSVELLGHVRAAGMRSLSGASTVKDLVSGVRNLANDPYLLFGIIERVDDKTRTRHLISFNPEKVFSGSENIALQDQDRVIFLGRNDIDFLTSSEIRRVIISGEYDVDRKLANQRNNPNFCAPLKGLSRIISDTQSDRFATATRAVFVRKSSEKQKGKNLEMVQDLEGLDTQSLRERITREQLEEEIEKDFEEILSCPSVYTKANNLLPFTLEYIVSVDGAVRIPGVYPITEETSAASLLSVSGGMSNDANQTHIEVTSYKTNANAERLIMNWEYVNSQQMDMDQVKVNPGGGIRVSSLYSNFESGAVLLTGEFKQPGVYTIRKGEKLSELIQRAGGLTDQAYPYGGVFARKRVKEIQRAELKKTAQHLQSAMVSASIKKTIEADSLMAAQQLTNQMADAEILGRVVIEADPVKLSLDPNKDMVLEPGDSLFIPKRPNFIVALGDVLNPGALQFIPGKKVNEYLQEVGGYTRSADKSRVYVVYPNGVARPITLSSWGGDRNLSIPPGSAIVVPTDLSPYTNLSLIKEIGAIFQNLAVSAASIAVLVR